MYRALVCMPYREEWSENVWDALSRMERADLRNALTLYRVDTSPVATDDLTSQIEKHISVADVVIFDLTGQNANVHLELGYALALGKPVLLIAQDPASVTSVLRGRVVESYNPNDAESLSGLSTRMLWRLKEKLTQIKAWKAQEEAQITTRLEYRVDCYRNRAVAGLHRYLRNARDTVDILTTNLSFLFETRNTQHEEADDLVHSYFDDIEAALQRSDSSVRVRILTLDPESDFAAKRGKQLGYAPALFRDNLRTALSRTSRRASEYAAQRWEIRTYDDFPNQIMFRVDDWIFHSVVAQPLQSRNYITLKFSVQQAGVAESFIHHFQSVWGRASHV